MKVTTIQKTDGNLLGATRSFLGKLLNEGIIDYLLVPQEISHGRTLTQTLVKDPAHLGQSNPFSPVMPMNSASIVAQLTLDNPGKKVGVVLKPCEIRAFVELVKLGQAKRENLLIIRIDCLGTFEVEAYATFIEEMEGEEKEKGAKVLSEMRKNIGNEPLPISLRTACKLCTFFTPLLADITFSVFGDGDEIAIDLEQELAERLGFEVNPVRNSSGALNPTGIILKSDPAAEQRGIISNGVKGKPGRQEAINALMDLRSQVREKVFNEFREKMKTVEDLTDLLATCIRCYACQSACPICYCKVCFFRTETFEPESERYFRWAEKEGALRMPTEILLYHLTRLNHMGASCIDCGMCESACPRGISLTTLFEAVGDGVKKSLNYVPGKSLEDEIPIVTFKEKES